jgi:hypothetical protein
MMRTNWNSVVAVVSGLCVGGCIRPGVSGKVVEGPGSVVVMFAGDAKDERIAGPGLEGATLVLKGLQTGSIERTIGTTKSNAKGEFSITFPRTKQGETMQLEATAPGHAPAQGQVGVLEGDRKLLVILKKISR